jgi:hypothetical protein
MSEKPLTTICIKIQTRRDGTVYISSDDMPGLWLWGKDHDLIFRSIAPTIEELYRLNEGRAVKVREAPLSQLTRWFVHECQQ